MWHLWAFEVKIGFESVLFNWFSQGIIAHWHVSTKLGQINLSVPGDEISLTSNISGGTSDPPVSRSLLKNNSSFYFAQVIVKAYPALLDVTRWEGTRPLLESPWARHSTSIIIRLVVLLRFNVQHCVNVKQCNVNKNNQVQSAFSCQIKVKNKKLLPCDTW